jgi:hypothetical protein
MIVKRLTLIVFILIIFIFPGESQNENTCYIQDQTIHITDTSRLFLQIDNNNYVKNNEYFGQVAEGYTLLGFNLTPRIVYFPSSKIKLSAGGNFLTYYGRENEVNASLLLSFQYKLHPNLDFVLGNIYGTVNHRLIDPLFNFERFLNQNIENGIQFLWNSDRAFADLWLDWEQQILQDDPFQEKFNVGLSSNFLLFDQETFQISIPFQNLIRHEGGQINSNSEEPLTTIFNNATGLCFSKPIHSKFLHHLDLTTYLVNYQDLSPTKRQMYIDGTASYTTLQLRNNQIDFTLGYWYGEQFVAPIGNPIFESYSRTKFYVEEPIRQLAIGKINYQKNVFNGINLGFRFEGFYDLLGSNLEYTWAAMVVFNEKFFLKAF